MRAFIDPETGQLGSPTELPPLTPEETAALEAQKTNDPVQIIFPDGSAMVDLKGTCQEFVVMEIDAQGKRTVRCVQHPDLPAHTPAPAAQPQDR
jgi:hypothetical protein